MENKKRNHISIVIEQSFTGLLALAFLMLTQLDDFIELALALESESIWYYIAGIFGVIILFGLVFLRNFLVWRKTHIWVENGNILVERNTIFHKKNAYQISHISNIDLEQNLFEQIIGTCKIKIDTNSSITASKTDIKIVFTKEEAEAFKYEILGEEDNSKVKLGDAPSHMSGTSHTSDTSNISNTSDTSNASNTFNTSATAEAGHKYGASVAESGMDEASNRKGVSAMGVIKFTSSETLRNAFVSVHPFSLVMFLLIIGGGIYMAIRGRNNEMLMESWLNIIGSFAATLLIIGQAIYRNIKRFFDTYDFRVLREPNRILIEQGLFKRSRKTIPLEKMNALIITQPFFARIFRLYQVEMVNIGMGDEAKENAYLLLACTKKQLNTYILNLVPEYQGFVQEETKRPSLLYYVHSLYTWIIPLVSVLAIGYYAVIFQGWLPDSIFYILLITLVVGYGLLATLSYMAWGYALGDDYMSISRGIFTRHCTMVPYDRIQNIGIAKPLVAHITGLNDVTCSIIADAKHTVIELPLMTDGMSHVLVEKMMATTYERRKKA